MVDIFAMIMDFCGIESRGEENGERVNPRCYFGIRDYLKSRNIGDDAVDFVDDRLEVGRVRTFTKCVKYLAEQIPGSSNGSTNLAGPKHCFRIRDYLKSRRLDEDALNFVDDKFDDEDEEKAFIECIRYLKALVDEYERHANRTTAIPRTRGTEDGDSISAEEWAAAVPLGDTEDTCQARGTEDSDSISAEEWAAAVPLEDI